MRRMQGKWQERGGVRREESGKMRIQGGRRRLCGVEWRGHDMSMQVHGDGKFFAMMNMGSHMKGKPCMESVDDRIVVF